VPGFIMDLLHYEMAGQEAWRIIVFFGVVLLSLIVGRLARHFMERAARHSIVANKASLSKLLTSLSRPVVLLAFAIGVWLALPFLQLSENTQDMAGTAVRVLCVVAVGYAIYRLVDVLDYYLAEFAKRTESKVDDMLVPLVGKSIRITVVVLILAQVVQSLSDKPLTSVIAGLGVGGLAIALAGQDTIRNFFGSLVILGDKPFEIGDRIVLDGHDGPVESVGFRSTRIRTLEGHLVTVPNAEMVNKTVQNIGKRPYIKRFANITITYDTPPEKVRRAVEIIKDILADHEGMNPDFPPRVFFSDFNDCSLNIMMLYWYHPPDYWTYMEFTEKVNHEILTRFNEEGIEFAFPTQTLYLANDEKRQLAVRLLKEQS
jgi:MscS family membrane protein